MNKDKIKLIDKIIQYIELADEGLKPPNINHVFRVVASQRVYDRAYYLGQLDLQETILKNLKRLQSLEAKKK